MTTDFSAPPDWRGLCEELTEALAARWPLTFDPPDCLTRARAALAAEADGPAVPEGREPASVVGEPSDEELAQAAKAAIYEYKYPTELTYFLDSDSSEYEPFLLALRAAIAADRSRFGRQPAPPAAGEVGELAAWLRANSSGVYRPCSRAADLQEQRQPAPVPVAERSPGPEDCDEEGCIWLWDTDRRWVRQRRDAAASNSWIGSSWLPGHALPLPAGEVQP